MDKSNQHHITAASIFDLWKGPKFLSWNASSTPKTSHISMKNPLSVNTSNNKYILEGSTNMVNEKITLEKNESETYCIFEWISVHLVDRNIGPNAFRDVLKTSKVRTPIGLYNLYTFTLSILEFVGTELNMSSSMLQDSDLYENIHLFEKYVHNKRLTKEKQLFYLKLIKNVRIEPSLITKIEKLLLISSSKKNISIDSQINHPYFEVHLKQLQLRGIKNQTIRKYLISHRIFIDWLLENSFKSYRPHDLPLELVRKSHLEDFKYYLYHLIDEGIYKEHTASDIFYEIRSVFNNLYKKGILRHWISQDITPISFDHYQYRDIPTEFEIQRFYKIVSKYSPDADTHLLAYSLMINLGFRRNEVIQLKWEHINLESESIIINGKGGYSDEMPLPSNLLHLLYKRRSQQPNDDYVFQSTGKNFANTLNAYFKLYTQIADWKCSGGLHLLRHTFLTRLSKHPDCTPQQLMRIARHRRPETTTLYIHRNDSDLTIEIEKIKFN